MKDLISVKDEELKKDLALSEKLSEANTKLNEIYEDIAKIDNRLVRAAGKTMFYSAIAFLNACIRYRKK